MSNISLSVIIPAKNEQKLIGACIDSANKSIDLWGGAAEIIVVDNGSTDNTAQIAIAMGSRVIKILEGTIARMRNEGAKNSNGYVLAFLDADCIVSPFWVQYCLQNFNDHDVGAVGTRAVPDLETSTWVEKSWYILMPGSKRNDFVKWLGTSNLFVKKKVFDEAGQFNEDLVTGEDVDLCNKITVKYYIKLEKRIDTIHLRESKTLYQLYKREYWRGSNSFSSLIKNKSFNKDFLSVFIPILNTLLIICSIFTIINNNVISFFSMISVLSFPLILMVRKRAKTKKFIIFFQVYFVAFTYLFARSVSITVEIYKVAMKLLTIQKY